MASPTSTRDTGLDYLLDLDGNIEVQNDEGYWIKNRHRHIEDEGVLYEFDTGYQLVSDFYAEVDRILKEVLS